MLTTCVAGNTPSRRQPSRSVPPAWTWLPGAARCSTASRIEVGRTYLKLGSMAQALPLCFLRSASNSTSRVGLIGAAVQRTPVAW